MTEAEKAVVRRLIDAYQAAPDETPDVSDAHCEDAEQGLDWRDFERATFLQDLAWRVAMQRRAAHA